MGGFASFPGALAAWINGIPIVIHEQNAVPGTANRWLSNISKKSLTAFNNHLSKAIIVGNPLRNIFSEILPPKQRMIASQSKLKLLVLGGSLGARAINEIVPEAMGLIEEEIRPDVFHQSGGVHQPIVEKAYKDKNISARVQGFIDDMVEAYIWADIVVCRSGALTISELAAVGVASLLIPYPYAIDDHQTQNAKYLTEGGGGWLIPQQELTPAKLADQISYWHQHREHLIIAANAARKLGTTSAAKLVADYCIGAANG